LLLSYSTLTSASIRKCFQLKQTITGISNKSSYLNRGKQPKTSVPPFLCRSYGITTVT